MPHLLSVRSLESARVHPSPDLVLEEPTGSERLSPQIFRRQSILGEELGERD
jgi:hypothetical protein